MATLSRLQFVLFLLLTGMMGAGSAGAQNIIVTVAGNGSLGFAGDGGLARAARLFSPVAVVPDTQGNLYFADYYNFRVRKVSSTGIITTVAGNGSAGSSGDGGPATAAQVSPNALALDSAGNLYIADPDNSRIRKVSPNGIITTFAGNGQFDTSVIPSGDGGPATQAALQPAGLAFDASGNLFLTDSNHIRKISTNGIITTIAGSGFPGFSGDGGPAISAQLDQPTELAFDAQGNLYVNDVRNARIRKISASGVITTVAGGGGSSNPPLNSGPATSAALGSLSGLAIDKLGNIYYSDLEDNEICEISGGIISRVAGGYQAASFGDGGPAIFAELSLPEGLALDASGNLLIADYGDQRIREIITGLIPPVVSTVNNAADYSLTVAQGSLAAIFGTSMGPTTLALNYSLPIPDQLSATTVTVTSGTTTLNCPLLYTSSGQVGAIIPSAIPAGPVVVTVSYNGQTGPYGLSSGLTDVTATSPGIFTENGSGAATGDFTEADGTPKSFTNSARPGDQLTLWLTGLGPISTPDDVLPPSFPNFPNVEVWFGGQQAQVSYTGRSGCCASIDQINFTVPAVANGCNVQVVVVSGGVASNTTTIPVNASGGSCSDSGPVLPTSFLTKAASGQPVNVAAIGVGPRSVGGDSAAIRAAANRLSTALHTPVPDADAARMMRALASGRPKAVRAAIAKYARQWKALDAQTKARLAAQIGQTPEGASAIFGTYTNESAAAAFVSAQWPVGGSCLILPDSIAAGQGSASFGLDAGQTLSLAGASGLVTLQQTGDRTGQYHGLFAGSISGPNVPVGSYTISGTGGAGVGAFTAALSIAGHLSILDKSSLATVDRAQPLTLTWSGGVPGKYILIGGYTPNTNATGADAPNVYFACAADGGAGTFTIPAYILASMNATVSGKGVLAISPHPLSNQITIPGIDLAYFIDGSSDSVNVTFK